MREKFMNIKSKNKKLAVILTVAVLIIVMIASAVTVNAGWESDENGWWYEHADGSYTKNDWEKIDGYYYYFNGSGYMLTGWQQINSNWYYLNPNSGGTPPQGGRMTGWQSIDGEWYYLNPDGGAMLTGWQTIGGKKYYLNPDGGAMLTDWQKIGGADYYFYPEGGAMASSCWIGDYWLGSDGKMAKDAWVDGDRYYVGADGACLKNQWKGDYYLGSNGAYVINTWVEEYYCGSNGKFVKNTWQDGYYLGADGKKTYNAWVQTDGKHYYCGASGKYVTGWQKINNVDYYFDASGAMLADDFTPDGYYVGSDGKLVYNKWIVWKDGDYYIDAQGKYVTGFETIVSTADGQPRTYYFSETTNSKYYKGQMAFGGWHTINGNHHYIYESGQVAGGWARVSNHWYYLDPAANGAMVTGWFQNTSGDWYFLNPASGSNHNSKYPEGAAFIGKQTVDGKTYYFDADGRMLDADTYYRYLNPYYEFTEGGLYGSVEAPITTRTNANTTYAGNVDKDINLDYLDLNIGAKAADRVDVTINSSIRSSSSAGTGWEGRLEWAWTESKNQAVVATEANRSTITNGGFYAIYRNIDTVGGRIVDLKVSVKDYALIAGDGETPIISFPVDKGKPGILVLNIAWVQLKYELLYQDGTPIPSTTKGTTSYYDVDDRQVICFGDNTNKGVFTRSECRLKAGTVSNFGILDGACVFWDSDEECPETAYYKYKQGFTEIFEGNTLVRTFSFQHADVYSNGGIYHDGQVVENGDLQVSKTVDGEHKSETFTFDIALQRTNSANSIVDYDAQVAAELYTGGTLTGTDNIAFTGGKATVNLKHNQSIKLLGLPTGVTFAVTERANAGYVSSGNISGAIVKDTVKKASFTNTEKPDLIIKKVVTGNTNEPDKQFRFTVVIKEPGKTARTETVWLKNGQSTTQFQNLLKGTVYNVTEDNYAEDGYATSVSIGSGSTTGDQTLNSDKTVTFTNEKKQATLILEKKVTGNGGDREKAFTFEVKLNGGQAETVKLAHGQTKSFVCPYGTTYEIKEIISDFSGYSTSIEGADTKSGVIARGTLTDATKAEKVTYTNKRTIIVPTGVDTPIFMTAVLLLITVQVLAIGGIFYYMKKRHHRV